MRRIVRARAPLRISFAGGGTDVPPYCDERGGAILSSTVNRYACASVEPGGDDFKVSSIDYDAAISYGIDAPFVYDGQLDLAKGVIDYFRREHGLRQGLEILLHNDAPPGSGLGSSSAITVAMIAAVSEYLRVRMDPYELAELAYRIERIQVGIRGGKQDHFASAFGGLNYMQFHNGVAEVHELRVPDRVLYELEYSLVFAYVGGPRLSSHIIDRQVDNYVKRDESAVAAMDELKRVVDEMKKLLLLGRMRDFGELLDHAWQVKKKMAQGITTDAIEELYSVARAAGALGGKISGAGGGGFMFFFCDPGRRFAVQDSIKRFGAQLTSMSFVKEGVREWSA